MQGPYLRKYGVETKINFVLYEVDGVDLRVDAADGGSDCSIMKDEGAEATCTNDFVDEGNGYSLTLDATEMEAARIVVYVVDSATKVWLDDAIVIETYGHASAMHAIDLDDGVRAGLTALPNAAADAAGGLPISDVGGLDLDAILADTNELQADDIPGKISTHDGKLDTVDTVVDAILADTGTDGVKLANDAITSAKYDESTAFPVSSGMKMAGGTIIEGTVSHDNTAASTTVFYSDDITEATADHYNGRIVIFTSGALVNQATEITDYALDSGEGRFTVTALTEAPADNVTFVIV